MRVVKEAEERKNEILDAAGELFSQKGFDSTSTNDILEKVGIARGTLYYHFKSKEDIMDALIERTTAHATGTARLIAADRSIPVKERMVRAIMALHISDDNGKELIEQMHKPQNALMHQKAQKAIIHGVTPILSSIIQDGIEQGIFTTAYPYECTEMLLIYANVAFDDDDMVEQTDDGRMQRIQAFIYNLERLLGVENGSLRAAVMQIFAGESG